MKKNNYHSIFDTAPYNPVHLMVRKIQYQFYAYDIVVSMKQLQTKYLLTSQSLYERIIYFLINGSFSLKRYYTMYIYYNTTIQVYYYSRLFHYCCLITAHY